MISVHTLLFVTDGSACAEHARPVAERLARDHHADLHVLRVEVVPVLAHVPFRAVPTFDTVGITEADVAADLHLPVPDPPPVRAGRTVEAVRRWPHVGEAILDYAADVGAGLIVMGTHGYSGSNRLVLGSTAEYVLRRSLCPVLTVGAEANADARGPVLCPLDFSGRSEEALAVAADFASALGAPLHVLHVVEPISMPGVYGYGLLVPPVENAAFTERSREEIHRVVADVVLNSVATTADVRSGYPEHEVLAVAEEVGAGLIVQSSHGRKGIARVFLGSVAETVIREASCPVLTLKASGVSLRRPNADALDRAAPLARTHWEGALDALSTRVRDAGEWTVGVDITSPELESGVLLVEQPFVGIVYDRRADLIEVMTEGGSHRIDRPLAIRMVEDDGATRLDIVRFDGVRERITAHETQPA